MSFIIEQLLIDSAVNETLLAIPSLLSPYYNVGDYKLSASNSDNEFWLLCDGRSLEISSYQDLYDVIGTSFGSVDSDHFNLPDFRGRVPGIIGAGTGLTNRTLGNSLGTETVTLSSSQIPSHSHTGTTDSAGTHNHSITDPGHTHTGTTDSS